MSCASREKSSYERTTRTTGRSHSLAQKCVGRLAQNVISAIDCTIHSARNFAGNLGDELEGRAKLQLLGLGLDGRLGGHYFGMGTTIDEQSVDAESKLGDIYNKFP